MDHSLRAAPHDFSQLATSFFACPRLGILRAPLLRLTRFSFGCRYVRVTTDRLRTLALYRLRQLASPKACEACEDRLNARPARFGNHPNTAATYLVHLNYPPNYAR
jgi:hypothetical protein